MFQWHHRVVSKDWQYKNTKKNPLRVEFSVTMDADYSDVGEFWGKKSEGRQQEWPRCFEIWSEVWAHAVRRRTDWTLGLFLVLKLELDFVMCKMWLDTCVCVTTCAVAMHLMQQEAFGQFFLFFPNTMFISNIGHAYEQSKWYTSGANTMHEIKMKRRDKETGTKKWKKRDKCEN